ncbi:MAG: PqqD family protein [Proteobacteria bacterium]|nr:PqqD family protein [Pseudomonadota bacterium]
MDALIEKPKKREDLAIHELGDEVMLYDATNEKIHVLNYTAYLIWKFCDGYHTIKAIEEEMNKNFPAIEYGDVLKDIRSTIDDFNKNKLLI